MPAESVVDASCNENGRPRWAAPPEVVRVVFAGEIDVLRALQLHRIVLDALRRHRPGRLDLDMRGVTFLDAAGIRCLLLCHADCEQLGCRFVLTDPRPMQRQVLRVTGLLERFGLPLREL